MRPSPFFYHDFLGSGIYDGNRRKRPGIHDFGYVLAPGTAELLGADEKMLPYCIQYARINMLGLIPFMLQNTFQSFLVTAERPKMGLAITIAAGCTNMVLDGLFVGVFRFGLPGAAWATVISQCIGGFIPLIYFIRPNKTKLHVMRTKIEWKPILRASGNGASEFMSNISMSIVNMLFNIYASSFFTALNNGAVSTLISFARTLVFTVICVLILPIFLQLKGVWWSVTASELMSLALSAFCLMKYRKRYGY